MDDEENLELMLLGYILGDNDLWQAGSKQQDVEEPEEPEEPPPKRRWWVRPWIKKRDADEANTMYKLQLELSQVCVAQMSKEDTRKFVKYY